MPWKCKCMGKVHASHTSRQSLQVTAWLICAAMLSVIIYSADVQYTCAMHSSDDAVQKGCIYLRRPRRRTTVVSQRYRCGDRSRHSPAPGHRSCPSKSQYGESQQRQLPSEWSGSRQRHSHKLMHMPPARPRGGSGCMPGWSRKENVENADWKWLRRGFQAW